MAVAVWRPRAVHDSAAVWVTCVTRCTGIAGGAREPRVATANAVIAGPVTAAGRISRAIYNIRALLVDALVYSFGAGDT